MKCIEATRALDLENMLLPYRHWYQCADNKLDGPTPRKVMSITFKFELLWSQDISLQSHSHMASSLHYKEFNLHLWNAKSTDFLDYFLVISKCLSWAPAVFFIRESCLFLMQCHLRAQRSQASSIDFWLCAWEISTDSSLKILCNADDKIFKVYAVLCLCPSSFLRNCASLRYSF